MTTRLEALEHELERHSSNPSKPTLFCYPQAYLSLNRKLRELETELSRKTCGAEYVKKARQILSEWTRVEEENPLPPFTSTTSKLREVVEVIQWTLVKRGFTPISFSEKSDSFHIDLVAPSTERVHLRVVQLSDAHVIAYLGPHAWRCTPWPVPDLTQLPLRFDLACIQPLLGESDAPSLPILTTVTHSCVLAYLSIHDMPELGQVNRVLHTAFCGDDVWNFVWNNLEKYSNGRKPNTVRPAVGEHREAVRTLIAQRQVRRQSAFVSGLGRSDWADPLHFVDRPSMVDPIWELRRRRIDVMDDLDLFM
jgi:hypothetical protein